MLGAEEPVMAASALARCGATLRLVVVALLLLLAGCGGGGGSGGSAASPAQSAPPQPTGFTAQAGDGEVALTWTALSAATGWEYRQRSEGGGWGAWTAIGGSGAATAGHTVTGLENGTAYGFQVRAVNAGGAGPASAEATATPDVPGVPVEIPDANLRRVLEQALGRSSGETITDADLRTLRILQAQGEGIANLTGLEHATGLTRLELDRNRVSDLAPLAMLTSLDRLYLSYNDVVDLEPLSGLGSLSWLLLEGNRVSDLAPLSSLTSLTNLNLTRNRVSDLSALAGLRELWALGVYENQASNLSPLAELTSLEFLNVGYNGVVDLQPLAGLTSLRELSAHINEIADLSPLRGLRFLEYLLLDNNPVEDAEPLSALTSMRYLSLEWFRAVDDLSFVSGMSELTYLDLQRTSVRDLGPLSALSELERLVISDTLVEDLSPLADLPSLQQLFIHNLRVDLEPLSGLESLRTLGQWSSTTGAEGPKVDIAPLAGLRNLERLTASPSHGDLSPLADLRSLQFLYLGEPGAPFEGLASLSGLSELRELTLEGGGLDEISALADLTALERLNLSGNRIEELAPLTGLESLSDLDLDDNRVVEVAPLAANPGLGTGDTVSLVGNPLGAEALRTHIPELESRGATVAYDRDDFPDSPLRVLHDGAVSMLVDADLDTVRWELDLEAYAQEFIAHFGDEFDVLLLLSALASPQDHADAPYYGYYHHVSSDVRGIGQGDPRRAAAQRHAPEGPDPLSLVERAGVGPLAARVDAHVGELRRADGGRDPLGVQQRGRATRRLPAGEPGRPWWWPLVGRAVRHERQRRQRGAVLAVGVVSGRVHRAGGGAGPVARAGGPLDGRAHGGGPLYLRGGGALDADDRRFHRDARRTGAGQRVGAEGVARCGDRAGGRRPPAARLERFAGAGALAVAPEPGLHIPGKAQLLSGHRRPRPSGAGRPAGAAAGDAAVRRSGTAARDRVHAPGREAGRGPAASERAGRGRPVGAVGVRRGFAAGYQPLTNVANFLLRTPVYSPCAAVFSISRGVPSRSPAEGFLFARGTPSRSPAEGSLHARGIPSRSPAEGSPAGLTCCRVCLDRLPVRTGCRTARFASTTNRRRPRDERW